jgi:predicted nucleic acid-binding protein
MIVVTNSGPLIALAKLGLLHLLGRLYGQVDLPEAVYDEVVLRGRSQGYSDSLPIKLAIQGNRLVVKKVKELKGEIAELPLHIGEKQVLSLALESQADLVLLDDMLARNEARARGISVKGTLGVIVKAYKIGFLNLNEVQTIFDDIANRDDIWIAKELCRRVFDGLKRED